MRSFDWSGSDLGAVSSWPQSLKTSVSLCLNAQFPMILWWGPNLTVLYNDPNIPMLGIKHPRALGQPGEQVWREIWPVVGPKLRHVMVDGQITFSDNLLLFLERSGEPEECYFTFSYSPIRDESGGVGGICTPVWETTSKVVSERRLNALRQLAECGAAAKDQPETLVASAEVLASNPRDLAFCAIYLLDPGNPAHARRAAACGFPEPHPAFGAVIDLEDPGWPLQDIARGALRGRPTVLENPTARLERLPGGEWPEPPRAIVATQLQLPGQASPVGFAFFGASARRPLDAEAMTFFELVSTQLGRTLVDARALPARSLQMNGAAARLGPERRAVRRSPPRVLLAGDSADFRDHVADLLGGTYEVVTVSDGGAALAALQSAAAGNKAFDLLLADVTMLGLDGFELLRRVRTDAAIRTVIVILLSARGGEASRIEGLEAGADDYLVKPLSPRELLARMAAHLAMTRMRQRITAALRESEERFRRTFEGAAIGFAIVDPNGRFRAANRALCDMLGYSESELVAMTFQSLTYPDDLEADLALVNRLLAGEIESYRLEKRFIHKRGHTVWVVIAISLVRDENGVPQYFVSQGTDITAQREAEQALAHHASELERSNAELEQFAYVASHDLQQPLRTVASYTELLRERYLGRLDERADRWITYVLAGVERMQRLIDDLLALARVHTHGGAFVETDGAGLVQRTWEQVRRRYPAVARLEHGELPIVVGDPGELEQLFQNLFDNALKYRRSDVQLEVQLSAQATVDPTVWKFTVRDNGIGLDMAYADRVFEIFQRLHQGDEYEGTGVGLAICKRIVERHGGRLKVESVPGQGAAFTFTLLGRAP
jgi:PAS domain S-box-containing protein